MPAGALQINGVDMATLGFRMSRPPGWLDIPQRTHPQAVRPTLPGALLSGVIQEGTRKLTLEGVIDATTDVLMRSNRDAIIAQILKTQPAAIILPDQATRFVNGYLENKTTDPGAGPSMIARTLRTVLSFLLLDPYWYETSAQNITLNAGVNRAPLGTAPSWPIITITGAAVNPTLSYRRYDGVLLGFLGITITNVGGDTLVVNMKDKTITKNGASIIGVTLSGDFFALDPAAAQLGVGAAAGDRPYVDTNSGAGTTVYTRAWR